MSVLVPPNNTPHRTSLPPRLRRSGSAAGERKRSDRAVLEAIDKVAVAVSARRLRSPCPGSPIAPASSRPSPAPPPMAQLRELIGGIELRLDQEATAAPDKASARRETWRRVGLPGGAVYGIRSTTGIDVCGAASGVSTSPARSVVSEA
jgi:hypothetical protein